VEYLHWRLGGTVSVPYIGIHDDTVFVILYSTHWLEGDCWWWRSIAIGDMVFISDLVMGDCSPFLCWSEPLLSLLPGGGWPHLFNLPTPIPILLLFIYCCAKFLLNFICCCWYYTIDWPTYCICLLLFPVTGDMEFHSIPFDTIAFVPTFLPRWFIPVVCCPLPFLFILLPMPGRWYSFIIGIIDSGVFYWRVTILLCDIYCPFITILLVVREKPQWCVKRGWLMREAEEREPVKLIQCWVTGIQYLSCSIVVVVKM